MNTPYTSSAPSAILPYSYAFAHPYYITYSHHHPDHKEDDGRKDETKNVVEKLRYFLLLFLLPFLYLNLNKICIM
jgi:hypothetical protein